MYYAPFDYINTEAKVVIVGITPGDHQMSAALASLFKYQHLQDDKEFLRQIKMNASYKGAMRTKIIQMLDSIGLNHCLNISTCEHLFNTHNTLVHTTSAIPYPVFYKNENYNGSSSDLSKDVWLLEKVHEYFLPEIELINNPKVIIPLGKSVSRLFKKLEEEDLIDGSKILYGVPHATSKVQKDFIDFEKSRKDISKNLIKLFQ